jgi:hypothetical protein
MSQNPLSNIYIIFFPKSCFIQRQLSIFIEFRMSTTTAAQWYKGQFLISTSQALLQHEVVNGVFDSDYMYWTKRLSDEAMKHMLSHSLCFGVYALPESSSEIAGQLPSNQPNIIH